MDKNSPTTTSFRVMLTKFVMPTPLELFPYLIVSLFVLLVSSRNVLLVILADGSPVTSVSISEVFGQRLSYVSQVLAIPIVGRIVLFLVWLAIGSVVYMFVWMFQNMAVDVYDDMAIPKLKNRQEIEADDSWWGSALSRTIFIGTSILFFIFFTALTLNLFLPALVQLFQISLQDIDQIVGKIKLIISILLTIANIHCFTLFWRLFIRTKSYIYNSF